MPTPDFLRPAAANICMAAGASRAACVIPASIAAFRDLKARREEARFARAVAAAGGLCISIKRGAR